MPMVRPRSQLGQGGKWPQAAVSPPWAPRLWKTRAELWVGPRDAHVGSARYNVVVSFVIREFRPEDFETLWQIDQECFPPGIAYSRQELKIYIRRRGSFTLIATDVADDKIAGFIVANGGRIGHIITIDVIAALRCAGLGSQLLEAAEERLLAGGSKALSLETAVDNAVALAFYKRHGYHVAGTWPRYYSNGVDALVLRKNLP